MKFAILALLCAAALALPADYVNDNFHDGAGYYDADVPKDGKWLGKVVVKDADMAAGVTKVKVSLKFINPGGTGVRTMKMWVNTDGAVVDITTATTTYTSSDPTTTFSIDLAGLSCASTNGDCNIYMTFSASCNYAACINDLTNDIFTRFYTSDTAAFKCFDSACVLANRLEIVENAEMLAAELATDTDANYYKFISGTARSIRTVVTSGLLSNIAVCAGTADKPSLSSNSWVQLSKAQNETYPAAAINIAVTGRSNVPFSSSTSYHLCIGAECSGAAALSAIVALLAAFFAML